MRFTIRTAALALIATAAVTLPAGTAQAADPCVSSAEVRAEVRALAASLRDDVRAKSTRAHLAAALVEALKTSRGVKADTPAERRALGQEISALAKSLKSADSKVARRAIVLEIRALREQRERGAYTAEERAQIKAAVNALKNATVQRTDRPAEARAVAHAFGKIHRQFNCR